MKMFTLFAKVRKKTSDQSRAGSGRLTLREIFSGRRRNEIKGIAWWAVSLFMAAACWPHAAGRNALGPAGEIYFRAGFSLLGVLVYLLPAVAAAYGIMKFKNRELERRPFKILGLVTAFITLTILVELIHPDPIPMAQVKSFYAWQGAGEFWDKIPKALRVWGSVAMPAGGIIAHLAAAMLITIISTVGSYIVCGTLFIISLYFLEAEPLLVKWVKSLSERLHAFIRSTRQASAKHLGYAAPAP
ncbi:hypothetical protein JW933_02430, partial [candidate division FCPU426 bacterium]|nr:hypothetical protein [candidate division FCPU426 bacterium]